MRNETSTRSVVTGALAAAMAWAGAGTAAAAPPQSDVWYTASTATALLGGEAATSSGDEVDLLGVVRVTAVERSGTSVDVQLYREGWSCEVSGEPTVASVTTLAWAAAAGSFTWTCTPDGSSGQVPAGAESGTAQLQLTWRGKGQVRKEPVYHCVGRFFVRGAGVEGELVLDGDRDATLTAAAHEADAYLAYDHHICLLETDEPAP